jgi:HD-like signal output (HDOD) protein
VATAVLVEELGSSISFDSEATYTAGLLHDIGRLGMLAAYGDRYAKLLEEAPAERVQFLAAERELFGIDHSQAGDWLAQEWQLPPRITEVIHNAHAVRLDVDPVSLTWLVAAACHFSEALGFGAVQSQSRLTDSQALESLPPVLRPRASRDVAGLRNYVVSRINVFA